MKRTSLMVAGFSAMVALGLIGYGCTSGDTVNDGTGGKGTGGSSNGTGGSTSGTGGSSSGTGGMTSSGSGGSTTGTGGSSSGTGGMTTTGTGGMTTTGTGGTTGGIPICASPAPADKSTCTPGTDISPCTKNCGVKAEATQPRAQKPCVCNAPGTWDCTNAGPCVYPPTFNKTCFALTPAPPACPTPLPVSNVTTCTNTAGATCGPLCGSATAGSYTTGTSTTAKVGYCACVNGIWQCASVNEWPM